MSKPMMMRFQEGVLAAIKEAEIEAQEAAYKTLDAQLDVALRCVEHAIEALQRAEVLLTNNKLPNSFA